MDIIFSQADNAWWLLKYIKGLLPMVENPLSTIYTILAWILGAIALYNLLKKFR